MQSFEEASLTNAMTLETVDRKQMSDTRYQTHNLKCHLSSIISRYRMFGYNIRCKISDWRYMMQDRGWKISDSRYKIKITNTIYPMQGIRCKISD